MRITNTWYLFEYPSTRTDKTYIKKFDQSLRKKNWFCAAWLNGRRSYSADMKYFIDKTYVIYEVDQNKKLYPQGFKELFKIPEEILSRIDSRKSIDEEQRYTPIELEYHDWLFQITVQEEDENKPSWILNKEWTILKINYQEVSKKDISLLPDWDILIKEQFRDKYRKIPTKEYFPNFEIESENSYSLNWKLFFKDNIQSIINTSPKPLDFQVLSKLWKKVIDVDNNSVKINNKIFKKKLLKIN